MKVDSKKRTVYFPYDYISESTKEILRQLNPDSPAYANIGKKCCFCRETFKKEDCVFPNKIMDSQTMEYSAHGNCLDYVMKKYPNVPINDLHGKIQRVRVVTNARL